MIVMAKTSNRREKHNKSCFDGKISEMRSSENSTYNFPQTIQQSSHSMIMNFFADHCIPKVTSETKVNEGSSIDKTIYNSFNNNTQLPLFKTKFATNEKDRNTNKPCTKFNNSLESAGNQYSYSGPSSNNGFEKIMQILKFTKSDWFTENRTSYLYRKKLYQYRINRGNSKVKYSF